MTGEKRGGIIIKHARQERCGRSLKTEQEKRHITQKRQVYLCKKEDERVFEKIMSNQTNEEFDPGSG